MNILHLLADEEKSKEVGFAIRKVPESTLELLVFSQRQNNETKRECYEVNSLV